MSGADGVGDVTRGPVEADRQSPESAPAGPPPRAASSVDDGEIGWPRAIVTGLAILLIGFSGAVLGANRILTKALGLRRTPREWLASGLFLLVIVVLAWVLRRLQARRLI